MNSSGNKLPEFYEQRQINNCYIRSAMPDFKIESEQQPNQQKHFP
jgi:hypothetical protein